MRTDATPRSVKSETWRAGVGLLIAAATSLAPVASAAAQTLSAAPASRAPAKTPAAALPNSADAYRIVADDWLARHKPSTAVILVKRGGRIVYTRTEKTRIDQPTLLGSLSKMITGVCVATLIRDGKLDFNTPMRDALSGFFARNGEPADKRFLDATVAQLLTHHSGMMGNPDGDVMLKIVSRVAREGRGGAAPLQAMLAEHLKHPLKRAPGASYAYSNAGYAALGVIVEDRTKRPYEDYCRDAVMRPLNIASAKLSPDWRVWSSMGGWVIAPTDYLALADVFDKDNPFLGDKVKGWIDAVRPSAGMSGGDWYSLGVIKHEGRGGWQINHSGQLNSRGVDAKGKRISAIIRATFARAPDGTAMFAAFTPAKYDNKTLNDLRSALGRATQAWVSFR